MANTKPPIVPSHVFPGLTSGANLCRPISLPVKYCPVSLILTVAIRLTSASIPVRALLSPNSRSCTMNAIDPPMYVITSIANPTLSVECH